MKLERAHKVYDREGEKGVGFGSVAGVGDAAVDCGVEKPWRVDGERAAERRHYCEG